MHSAPEGVPDVRFQIWSEGDRVILAQDGKVIASEPNPNAIRSILLQEIIRCAERGREWLAILHAGACGDDTSCVLLAGNSHSGKTTLAAALTASGLRFYCDDSAVLGSDDGKISPMPFGLMLREGSWSVLLPRFPELASSAVLPRHAQKVRFLTISPAQIAAAPGVPEALVFVSFSPHQRTALRSIDFFESLLRLQESGFWVRHDGESIARFLVWLQSLSAFSLVYSDLDEAISAIREIKGR